MINSLLRKPVKVPDILFYHPPGVSSFSMIDRKIGKRVGMMDASLIEHNNKPYMELDCLLILPQYARQGYGTTFINFAKNMSKKIGCEGRLSLTAERTAFDPHNPPHLFYAKQGFVSEDKKLQKKMERCIRRHKPLNLYTPATRMYLG